MLSVARGPARDTSGKWMTPICVWTKALPEDSPNQKAGARPGEPKQIKTIVLGDRVGAGQSTVCCSPLRSVSQPSSD